MSNSLPSLWVKVIHPLRTLLDIKRYRGGNCTRSKSSATTWTFLNHWMLYQALPTKWTRRKSLWPYSSKITFWWCGSRFGWRTIFSEWSASRSRVHLISSFDRVAWGWQISWESGRHENLGCRINSCCKTLSWISRKKSWNTFSWKSYLRWEI